MSEARPRLIVGWREWIRLPALGIDRIKVKVDTGARTSALHAYALERTKRGRRELVRFRVHPAQRDTHEVVSCEAEVVDERLVRSSSGREQLRPVILTTAVVLGRAIDIELTLTGRDAMGFRMLLGRQAVRGRFLVDPGRSYVGGQPAKPKKRARR